jgi:hypothetical protein
MKPKSSLLYSQLHATSPYPEPDESIYILISYLTLSYLCLGFLHHFFLLDFPIKTPHSDYKRLIKNGFSQKGFIYESFLRSG